MADILTFDNRFVRDLPADPISSNERRQVPGASYSLVMPTPVADPKLISYSSELVELLGLDVDFVASEEFARVFAGNDLLSGMEPFAMNYAGHQFGSWAGQLGDGRAINLGEAIAVDGSHWTLQLKGAGATPYSRTADGRAVLRSSIREFLCSEAMHHLGVPTTRALSLVTTGEPVLRDMFYDGNPELEPGAVVCRVSPSFLRFGNFQIHAARQEHDILRDLIHFCIERDFPHLGPASEDNYVVWFREIMERTANLMVHWMRVGFVHGVMNTDNMSILGLTIDYGPYGWIDGYELDWTPNTTDAQSRRYIFGNQPVVAHWNLVQLAKALLPVVTDAQALQDVLDAYPARYQQGYKAMMAAKLGLSGFDAEKDSSLFEDLNSLLLAEETDMTLFYRLLADLRPEHVDEASLDHIGRAWYDEPSQTHREKTMIWLKKWADRVVSDPEFQSAENYDGADRPEPAFRRRMNATNPKYILRNYLAQQAIDRAHEGDFDMISELLDVMRKPYDEQPQYEAYFEKRPDWARNKAGCSMLSCSS